MGVSFLKTQLFGAVDYVCGGHGARRPSHGQFKVPAGITIRFYIADTQGLPNNIGQQVDRILAGGAAPPATETFTAGQDVDDYHLYSPKAGGYLNLGMSSGANPRYISTNDKNIGLALSDICAQIVRQTPVAVIHWSACRSVENDGDSFGWSQPVYNGSLGVLSSKVGKI
jgi:Putative adhesin Stv domain